MAAFWSHVPEFEARLPVKYRRNSRRLSGLGPGSAVVSGG
jgi:hypothetical protein